MITIRSATLGKSLEFTSTEGGWYRLRVTDAKGTLMNAGYAWAVAGAVTVVPWVGPQPAAGVKLQAVLERGWWASAETLSFAVVPPAPEPQPEPQPEPKPEPTPEPQPQPGTPTWPNATNTGVPAGTNLTPMGGTTVTAPNTVIEGKLISGTIAIAATGVKIMKCNFVGDGSPYAVNVRSGDVTIEDCEFQGNWSTACVAFDNWTMRRCNVHGMPADGCKLGSNVTLEDCYLHDFDMGEGAHADGGQLQNGVQNLVVRRNSISCAGNEKLGNAALFIAPDLGPSTNGPVLIENNLLHGGNYTLYCVDGKNGTYYIKNITIRGNRFRRGARYGARNVNVDVDWSNNVFDDNDEVIQS